MAQVPEIAARQARISRFVDSTVRRVAEASSKENNPDIQTVS